MFEESTHQETYDRGMRVRRAVLGDEYVDKSLDSVTAFSQPMQELVTEYCWGGVWARDGLPHRTRSMLNLAMLTVMGRSHEFKVHVRGALNNGVTAEEIQEVLLQTAIYAGVPAALESFRIASEVIDASHD